MDRKKYTYNIQASIIAGLFCVFILSSCGPKNEVLATVNDVTLLRVDAEILMQHQGLSIENPEDLSAFVNEWVENEIFIAELETKFPNESELAKLRSKNYEGELAKFSIEKDFLKKKLDTIVTTNEIEEYYNSHKEEFILHDFIVKALYLKIPKEVDYKSDKINQAFLLKNDKDLSHINSYAKLYAQNYYFNDSSWVYFNEISKDIPSNKYNLDNIVLNRSKTYFSDDKFTYFINVIDFKLKDEAPPVDFLSNEIKNIIITRRLQELKRSTNWIKELKKKHEISITI